MKPQNVIQKYLQNCVLHSSGLHTTGVDLVWNPNFLSSKERFFPKWIVFLTHVEVTLQIPAKVNYGLGIHSLLDPVYIIIGLDKSVNPYFQLIYRARLVPYQCVLLAY